MSEKKDLWISPRVFARRHSYKRGNSWERGRWHGWEKMISILS